MTMSRDQATGERLIRRIARRAGRVKGNNLNLNGGLWHDVPSPGEVRSRTRRRQ
jgi:hypothetical protein